MTHSAVRESLNRLPKSERPKNNQLRKAVKGDWAEDIAHFDSRRYIAYLKADGNDMGALFRACQREGQANALSKALPEVLRESLAEPCDKLLRRIDELILGRSYRQVLPVLPLILGGDDLFALLPAPWALHFATEFCRAYEENLKVALQCKEINLWNESKSPTIAAAVVICKSNYPYALAHRRAEALLKAAKRQTRLLEMGQEAMRRSILDFQVITGNEVSSGELRVEDRYRGTLRPYIACGDNGLGILSVERLLAYRLVLKDLPGKRRAELERLYDPSRLPNQSRQPKDWQQDLKELLERIEHAGRQSEAVKRVLRELGDESNATLGYWYEVERGSGTEFHGHGLPDLLTVWNYARRLDVPLAQYEG